jgi:hypothetical protein
MGQEELCILCGINPLAGPLWLLLSSDVDRVTQDIVSEIDLIDGESHDELVIMVQEALSSSCAEDERRLGYIPKWRPPGVTEWFAFQRCVAIGHFDSQHDIGGAVLLRDANAGSVKIPSGKKVEVRSVDYYSHPWFTRKLMGLAEDAYGNVEEVEEDSMSRVSSYEDNPNFFMSEGCYHYLQAWLHLDLMPPRSRAFPAESVPLTFGGEFYEVVNSRHAIRGDFSLSLSNIVLMLICKANSAL